MRVPRTHRMMHELCVRYTYRKFCTTTQILPVLLAQIYSAAAYGYFIGHISENPLVFRTLESCNSEVTMASTYNTKCCRCARNTYVVMMCVLHMLGLVAILTYINLQYCPNGGRKHCKRQGETDEEYIMRNVTSAEKQDCHSKIKLQLFVNTVDCFFIRSDLVYLGLREQNAHFSLVEFN